MAHFRLKFDKLNKLTNCKWIRLTIRFKNLFIVWQYDSFKYHAMLLTELGRMKTLASFYKETTNGGKSLVLAYLFSDFNETCWDKSTHWGQQQQTFQSIIWFCLFEHITCLFPPSAMFYINSINSMLNNNP